MTKLFDVSAEEAIYIDNIRIYFTETFKWIFRGEYIFPQRQHSRV